jgi:hypothetical protein
MKRKIYTEERTRTQFDDTRTIVYLHKETIEGYVPETEGIEGESAAEPVTAYAYTGPEEDGGTLIVAKADDRDSIINGIIRSRYSQSQEDSIKTHQLLLMKNPACDKADDYNAEWDAFNAFRQEAIATVSGWFTEEE